MKKWEYYTDKPEEEEVEIFTIETREVLFKDLLAYIPKMPYPQRIAQLESDHKKAHQEEEVEQCTIMVRTEPKAAKKNTTLDLVRNNIIKMEKEATSLFKGWTKSKDTQVNMGNWKRRRRHFSKVA